MKFENKYTLKSQLGQTRTVRKFLLWPRSFESTHTRWLEYADIVERVDGVDVGGSSEWGNITYMWCEIGFADELTTENNKDCK